MRVGLDRGKVVAVAARLIDREGFDALTLAGVARLAGVRGPSLFKHVDGLEDLVQSLAVLGLASVTESVRRATVGKARALAVAAASHSQREFAREHPGLYAAVMRAPDPSAREWVRAGREFLVVWLQILAAFDLHGDAALHAVRAWRSALHGFISLEAAHAFWAPLGRDGSFDHLVAMLAVSFERPVLWRRARRSRR